MDIVELLIQFNLTRQEASIYSALLSEGDMNGYEVAKITGISRSNTYASLAALVDKGCALVIEGKTTRYTPVPIEESCNNKIRKLQEVKQELIKNIPTKRDGIEGYVTIKGESHILDKMKNMVSEAKERVYISAASSIAAFVFPISFRSFIVSSLYPFVYFLVTPLTLSDIRTSVFIIFRLFVRGHCVKYN
jgi:sugar-specific transcriptional regulator TrmB